MKLIVGLGNPGAEYEKTRHNVGFMVIDNYATEKEIKIKQKKYNGLYASFMCNNEKIILLKPMSYMNLSGIVIKKYMDYFNINIQDILIIHDDLDINLENIKLKLNGGTAGHNGLKNIEDNLRSDQYKRLRIGIGKDNDTNVIDYVTSPFLKEEKEKIDEVIHKASNIINDYINIDFDKLMNKYN